MGQRLPNARNPKIGSDTKANHMRFDLIMTSLLSIVQPWCEWLANQPRQEIGRVRTLKQAIHLEPVLRQDRHPSTWEWQIQTTCQCRLMMSSGRNYLGVAARYHSIGRPPEIRHGLART